MKTETGIELITKERQEQIEKHGFDAVHDSNNFHRKGELSDAAMYAIEQNPDDYPSGWDNWFKDKLGIKSYKDRLIIAGALIAAEIDRIQRM